MTDSGNMKRREFISKLSSATGGLTLAPSILFGNKSQNKKIRLALLVPEFVAQVCGVGILLKIILII